MSLSIEMQQDLKGNGLEGFGLYYSFYNGLVKEVSTNDLMVKVEVPELASAVFDCKPLGIYSGPNYGIYALPQKGDNINVFFQNGDINFPFWSYGAVAKKDIPQAIKGNAITIISPNGVLIQAKEGKLTIKAKENTIELLENGKISIKNNSQNLKTIISTLIGVTKNMNVITPAGNGTLSPAQIVELEQLEIQLGRLLV